MSTGARPGITANTRKVILLQLLIGSVVALGFMLGVDVQGAQSALFGMSVSIASALLLSRGVMRASSTMQTDKNKGMLILYLGAVQRFIMVLALFALGVAYLNLQPVAMIAAFGAAQMAYIFLARRHADVD